MSDASPESKPADLATAQAMDDDAFVSFTHSDRPVVSGRQKGLHHIGRRLGQLRALSISGRHRSDGEPRFVGPHYRRA